MPAILHPILLLICCRLLAHHKVTTSTSRPLSKPWDYVRAGTIYLSGFQLPYLLPGCPASLLAGWLQAIARLQQQKIAQRLRIQPSAKQPNRRGESGICVELPIAFLICDYPPSCLGVPRLRPVRRQQIRIGRMLSIPLGWLGHKLITSTLHSFG